ncbi:MAG: signal peptidase II [Thermodesulfovibrionales bacterium]|nr:signal peptidase II [Thermodesulfovibrionales bacterium]
MKNKAIPVAVTVVLVTALDLITKHLAASRISPYEPIEILPFMNLVNVQNRGAAFGMFSAFGSWFFIAISISAIAFIIYLLVKTNESPVALALIMAGALGNVADRLMLGYVRDFLDVHAGGHHWPAFNVADSALTVGLAMIIVLPIIHGIKQKKKPGAP